MKKKINYTERNESELMATLASAREELRAHRFAAAGARAKDTSAPAKLRATVARVMTELGRRTREGVTEVTA